MHINKAIIAEKTKITVGNLQNRLMLLAEKAEAQKELSVAKPCIDSLLKTIGGFQTDAVNPKNLQHKELPESLRRKVLATIEEHYSRKYLASEDVTVVDVKQVESTEVKPDNNS